MALGRQVADFAFAFPPKPCPSQARNLLAQSLGPTPPTNCDRSAMSTAALLRGARIPLLLLLLLGGTLGAQGRPSSSLPHGGGPRATAADTRGSTTITLPPFVLDLTRINIKDLRFNSLLAANKTSAALLDLAQGWLQVRLSGWLRCRGTHVGWERAFGRLRSWLSGAGCPSSPRAWLPVAVPPDLALCWVPCPVACCLLTTRLPAIPYAEQPHHPGTHGHGQPLGLPAATVS